MKSTLVTISFVLTLFCASLVNAKASHNHIADEPSQIASIQKDSLAKSLTNFSISDFDKEFRVAKNLMSDTINIANIEKGVNLMAALAKEVSLKVSRKEFNLDSDETNALINKFNSEKFYINKPPVSRFIKLMNYTCMGHYSYVYGRFKQSSFHKPVTASVILFILCLIVNNLKSVRWKYKSLFNKLSILGLVVFTLIFLIFKLSCSANIQEYSFYGIPF